MQVAGGMLAPATPLVGRRHETSVVMNLITDDSVRLVVLTGTAGVGKSRLAMHVGDLARTDFPDGVWRIPLASVPYPDLVMPTIARTLGLWERSRQSLRDRLHAMLAGKRALLILDNFEQVSKAAPELIDLLAACPNLTILVTSRSVLHISGEYNVLLTPLPLTPSLGAFTSGSTDLPDAIHLFVERARAVRSDFELTPENVADVHELCRRLEGLPLAIELAAAHAGKLTPRDLVNLLDHRLQFLEGDSRDLPDRLSTMRSAIEWSYDLLTPDEQQLFRRVSVFSNGMPIEAILEVAMSGADEAVTEWIAIDTAASLVDQSLMFQLEGAMDEPRFFMMDVIREYGLEHLAASGEEHAIRDRHAHWCLSLAERIDASYSQRLDTTWRDRLEQEHANLRAALEWFQERGEIEHMLTLANTLFPLWWHLGHTQEGVRWLSAGLDRTDGVATDTVVRSMLSLSRLLADQTEHQAARRMAARAESLARESGHISARADAIFQIARNLQLSGNVDRAQDEYRRAQSLYRQIDDEVGVAVTNTYLAMLGEFDDGFDAREAIACWETELRLHERRNDPVQAARAQHGLSYASYLAGDYPRALALAHEALQVMWSMGDIRLIPSILEDVGDIAGATGQAEAAVRLYGAANTLREQIDSPIPLWFQADYDRELNRRRRELSPERFDAAWKAGSAMSLPEAVEQTLAIHLPDDPDAGASRPNRYGLTDRQREVLQLLVDGATNQEIATKLKISRKTVANHVGNILSRLGVDSRTAAVSRAIRDELA